METRGIAEGMTVRARDGKKLGKVIECAEDSFVVEKGLFFPKDYSIRYDQVAELREGDVYLSAADVDLTEGATGQEPMTTSATSVGAAGTPAGAGMSAATGAAIEAGSREEVRVPLAEEQLEAQKVERQAGEVRVHKEVVSEQKQISVPVTREEVHVERVPASGQAPAEASFQEKTISVPVKEEEVEIRKRPVVKEEVRVSRNRRQEERRADAEVRHEEARIEGSGELEGSDLERKAGERKDFDETRDFDTSEDLPRSGVDEPER